MQAEAKPTIFRFNCPVCGAHPKEQSLISYLDLWKSSPKSKIESLINIFRQILEEILEANLPWKTSKFSAVLKKELEFLESIVNFTKIDQHKKSIIKNYDGTLISSFDCPFCETPSGPRPRDRYFFEWSDACIVQVANVVYEVGIVLYAVVRALPSWADSKYLGILSRVLKANRKTQEATGLSECPLCGRFTTCIYGTGTKNNPCRCRWCLDRGGGIAIGITVNKDLEITVVGNKSVAPISEEIVPLPQPRREDVRPFLIIEVLLPSPPDPNLPDKVLSFWQNILNNRKKIIVSAFKKSLNRLLNEGVIKRFTNMSGRSYYWNHPFNLSDCDTPANEFALIDFVKPGFYQIGYVSFDVYLPHDGRFKAPSQRLPEGATPFGFIKVNSPWEIHLHSTDVKHLKTQDNYRFKVFVGLRFPLLHRTALPNKGCCEHEFRLLDLGVWEWQLVWECKYCGYACYCLCFKRAINSSPYRKEYLERYGEKIDIRPSELPFHNNACEVCRGQPSTNRFCHEMYARNIFEIKYGAYVRKRMVELKLEGYNVGDEQELELVANNMVRKELGFPPVGEKWVTETELYRIIKSLFPNEKVIHHYRDKWLEGLELDIYIPRKKLGVEYHGEQHFKAIDAWGGGEALAKTQERDIKKRKLCKRNNVLLVVFTYEENINPRNVKGKLITMGCDFT